MKMPFIPGSRFHICSIGRRYSVSTYWKGIWKKNRAYSLSHSRSFTKLINIRFGEWIGVSR
jgi:hypothetical protein